MQEIWRLLTKIGSVIYQNWLSYLPFLALEFSLIFILFTFWKSVFLFAWFGKCFLEKHQKAFSKWQVTRLPFFGYTLFFVAIWKIIGYLGTCAILFGYMELAFHANLKPSNWIQKVLGKLGFLGYPILFGYMKSYNRKMDTW